jgi:hypothetical protein
MNRPSKPFNAEERDLAERLARLGGPREPAPALDAKILAMARAAVAEPADASVADTGGDAQVDATPVAPIASDPTPSDPKVTPLKPRPRKPTQRWPLGLSLAASLVLAAGIGWKLHDNGAGIGEGAAETAVAAAAEEDATQIIMVEPPLQREPPPPPPPMESRAMADASVAPAAPVAPPAPAAKPAPAREAPQNLVYAAEAAADAAPPPAAMAAPAPVAQASEEAEQDSYDRIDVSGSRIRRAEREVGAAEYTRREQEARRRQAVAERAAGAAAPVAALPPPPAPPPPPTASARGNSGFVGDAAAKREVPKATSDYDDRPPVSADSPEFRQAWLQRIRELLVKGEQAWARESLREFKRRYPDAELPEDLKPLAATLTTP